MQKLYIIIRSDIHSMNTGRIASMASHITSDFHALYESQNCVPEYVEWKNQSKSGCFGTVVLLHATLNEIIHIVEHFKESDMVVDDEFHYRNYFGNYVDANVTVGAWVFVNNDTPPEQKILLEKLLLV